MRNCRVATGSPKLNLDTKTWRFHLPVGGRRHKDKQCISMWSYVEVKRHFANRSKYFYFLYFCDLKCLNLTSLLASIFQSWQYPTQISYSLNTFSGALKDCFSWPLGPCLRDLKPNWAAHGSGMWVTENSNAENKTCCCNDGGGSARTYWQEDMIQLPGLFFSLPF